MFSKSRSMTSHFTIRYIPFILQIHHGIPRKNLVSQNWQVRVPWEPECLIVDCESDLTVRFIGYSYQHEILAHWEYWATENESGGLTTASPVSSVSSIQCSLIAVVTFSSVTLRAMVMDVVLRNHLRQSGGAILEGTSIGGRCPSHEVARVTSLVAAAPPENNTTTSTAEAGIRGSWNENPMPLHLFLVLLTEWQLVDWIPIS